MKILNVHQYDYALGGSEKYFHSLRDLLESNGNSVVPFSAKDEKNNSGEWERFFTNGSDFDRRNFADIVNFIYCTDSRKKIAQLLDEQNFEIAHLHTYYGKISSSILPELVSRRVPIIQTLHGYKLVCPVYTLERNGKGCDACKQGRFYNGVINRCNRGSLSRSLLSVVEMYVSRMLGSVDSVDRFICVSEAQKKLHCQMGIPEEKISVVHNFINPLEYVPTYSVGDYILYFGRMEPLKGIGSLIAASKQLGMRLVLTGEGSELEKIRKDEAALIRQGQLVLTGLLFGQELMDVIRGAGCVVVPTLWGETFGLAAAEAMACGKPVIASNTGGLPEVVDDGNTGLLFEPGNAVDLTEKISRLMADKALAMKMGENGRRRVEEHFSPEAHYIKIMQIYNDVISGYHAG